VAVIGAGASGLAGAKCLLDEVLIEHISVADEITLTLCATSLTASCPNCGTLSTRVQSRYRRTLHDLPSAGCPVHLIVYVRRLSTCNEESV
jgi:transposase